MTFHPYETHRSPSGKLADIDVLMAPLILALWESGYQTIGCCQDIGESTQGYSYWSHPEGYALLEMPVADTVKLLDRVYSGFRDYMHWSNPGAWRISIPVIPMDTGAEVLRFAQIYFPAEQIAALAKELNQ